MEKSVVLIGIGGAGTNTIERIKDKIKIESGKDMYDNEVGIVIGTLFFIIMLHINI